jgi:hypothetical protein
LAEVINIRPPQQQTTASSFRNWAHPQKARVGMRRKIFAF